MQIIETNLKRNGSFSRRSQTTELILHHAEASSASVETINEWHLKNGWTGIGYHYYIRKNGNIYRGRPEWAIGAHASGHNSVSIGVCCEGAYNTETMPSAQYRSLLLLISDIMNRYNGLTILRHKDTSSTDCPGKNFPFQQAVSAWKTVELEEEDDMTADEVKKIIADSKVIYQKLEDIPAWGKETVQKLYDKEYLKGDGKGLNLSEETLRVLVINDRAGLYD